MSTSVSLEWKDFAINLSKMNEQLKNLLSSNYDGLVCSSENLIVMFKDSLDQVDADTLDAYWSGITPQTFAPTLREIVTDKIGKACTFGSELISSAAIENVLMGITKSNKTGMVADYCHKLTHYLLTGSLYQALTEIARLQADTQRPDLSPFITNERLETYAQKIRDFLEL